MLPLRYFNGYVLYPFLEKRSGRNVLSKLKEVRSFDQLSNSQQLEAQKKYLFDYLEFCGTLPYYQQLFTKYHFTPSSVLKDVRAIQQLPIMTKQQIVENTKSLRSSTAYHERKTGGSTGKSLFVYYDSDGLDWTAAINLRSYEMCGKRPHHKDMHSSADQSLLEAGNIKLKWKMINWAKLFAQNRSILTVNDYGKSSLEKMYKQLRRCRPYLLQAHPSTIYALAKYLEPSGRGKGSFDFFEPSGEMLTDKMSRTIEEVFSCKVANRYGNAEFGVVAHSRQQDGHNKLRVFRRSFYVEEVEAGALLVTGYTNKGFPLLRYDTGDVATVVEEGDGCFLYDIQGRVHDQLELGGKVYPTHVIMDYLDHKVKGVSEFQIVLNDHKRPQLNLIPECVGDKERILSEVGEPFAGNMDVVFITFDQLEKQGWRNKFRHIVDKRGRS